MLTTEDLSRRASRCAARIRIPQTCSAHQRAGHRGQPDCYNEM